MKKTTFTGTVGRTLAETNFKYHTVDTNPKGAPNVIYIVLDDMGFAQLGIGHKWQYFIHPFFIPVNCHNFMSQLIKLHCNMSSKSSKPNQ